MDELLPLLGGTDTEQDTFTTSYSSEEVHRLAPVDAPTFSGITPEVDVFEETKKARPVVENPPASLFDSVEGYPHNLSLKPVLVPPPVEPKHLQRPPSHIRTNNVRSIEAISPAEAREALSTEVSSHFCWSKKPLHSLSFIRISAQHAYDYCLSTYGEMRFVKWSCCPYRGDPVRSAREKPLDPWSVHIVGPESPFRKEEFSAEIPNTTRIKKCYHCNRFGKVRCFRCLGRGKLRCMQCKGMRQRRIKDKHGNMQIETCTRCAGVGRRRCSECVGHGQTFCDVCAGFGELKLALVIVVKRTTLETHHIADASLPGNTITSAEGVEVYHEIAQKVGPLQSFPNQSVNVQSAQALESHFAKSANMAQVLCQRQIVRAVPVHECIYTYGGAGAGHPHHCFWVVGLTQKVHIHDYPAKNCCGLCQIV